MSLKLCVETEPCALDSESFRIGGFPLIGKTIDWPKNSDGDKLFLAISLPTNILTKHFEMNLPIDEFISVFTTYSFDDYFLDKVTFNCKEDNLELISCNTKVLLHPKLEANTDGPSIQSHSLSILDEEVQEPYQGSKFGGFPTFLQSFANTLEAESKFILQLYSSDFPEEVSDFLGLSDSVGYLFIYEVKDDCDTVGIFFSQCT